jgi:hypothetical protein
MVDRLNCAAKWSGVDRQSKAFTDRQVVRSNTPAQPTTKTNLITVRVAQSEDRYVA